MTDTAFDASKQALAKAKGVLLHLLDSIVEARQRRVDTEIKARCFDLYHHGDTLSSIVDKVQNTGARRQE